MPRLTFRDYCARRTLLTILYEQHGSAFIRLTLAEQRALHDYYVPSLDLELVELKAHRTAITTRQPSLPQRAGRAWAHLENLQSLAPTPVVSSGRRRALRIRVSGVLRPTPDYHKFARALLHVISERRS